jgi:hypothetical protein
MDSDGRAGHGFLRRILAEGGSRVGAQISGPAVFGWRDRTIGAEAVRAGERCWLRATGERQEWAGGDAWSGLQDAGTLPAQISRPYLLGQAEWTEGDVSIQVQLMTLAPGIPCSATPELRQEISLPDAWWTDLRQALSAMAGAGAEGREPRTWDDVSKSLRIWFGEWVDPAPEPLATAHKDLHWANLTQPQLCILDWEFWGRAEAGHDAATLYCHSLLVPSAAAKVHEVFADVLDSRAGWLAQLSVITHMLRRADGGDYADLVLPLHRLADRLLGRSHGGRSCVH